MGGEHSCSCTQCKPFRGSSPHGRGTRRRTGWPCGSRRVIPAWAGNTTPRSTASTRRTGHPRMGGEHRWHRLARLRAAGSSPHGRGTRGRRLAQQLVRRVIPAWAGNTLHVDGTTDWQPGHPRMGGEHTIFGACKVRQFGSSPHGRGTRQPTVPPAPDTRVIPAWAGNTGLLP